MKDASMKDSKPQEKPQALKRYHPAPKHKIFSSSILCFIFALLDPDLAY